MPSFDEHPESAARMLALTIVLTAPSEGRTPVYLPEEGTTLKLPRHIRRMKLHRLMNHEAFPAN
jgi:hypothetical protein